MASVNRYREYLEVERWGTLPTLSLHTYPCLPRTLLCYNCHNESFQDSTRTVAQSLEKMPSGVQPARAVHA